MTAVFVFGLCLAGFVLGFLVLYTIRRRYRVAKPARQETSRKADLPPCPWCGKKDYSAAKPSFSCPECGTAYHRACWEEYGGCSIFDCRLAPTGEQGEKGP